jgi:hypothetical protein
MNATRRIVAAIIAAAPLLALAGISAPASANALHPHLLSRCTARGAKEKTGPQNPGKSPRLRRTRGADPICRRRRERESDATVKDLLTVAADS